MPGRSLAVCALAAIALLSCMPPPKVGAPRESYTPATFTVKIADSEESVAGAAATPQFFAAERVAPMLGRVFTEADLTKGSSGVAVLHHRYWVERFQSSPALIGSQILVDGRPHVIIGVAPAAFEPEGAGLLWIAKKP